MDKRIYDKYIIQIIEHGTLTKAAASLGISQPALSSGLTNLENELGFKIFNRRSMPISFTPEGEIYYEYIKKLQVLTEDFQQRIDSYQEESNCKVVVGGPVVYVETLVTDTILELGKVHANYKFVVKNSPLSELIEMSAKGEINCFICTTDKMPENFEKKLIKQERMYLCIPKGNQINEALESYQVKSEESEHRYFDYSILDGEEFIFLEEGQPLYEQMESFFAEYHITAKNMISVNQVSTALNLAIKGRGICFASEEALEGNYDLSNVCIYALPSTISGRNIYVAYDRNLFMPAACKDFIYYLINR